MFIKLLIGIVIIGLIAFGLRPILAVPLTCDTTPGVSNAYIPPGSVVDQNDQIMVWRAQIFGTRCASPRLTF